MSSYVAISDRDHEIEHHDPQTFIRKYVWSQDHKVIAIQYGGIAILVGLVALALSMLMRLQLGFPDTFTLIDPSSYYQAVTMHGMIMVIYLLTALFLGGFGNYLTRLTNYWRSRFPWTTNVSESMCRAIVDEFRGDFEFVPPLSSVVADIESELLRLTTEQFKVLDLLSEHPRVVIRGGAGTGKTVLAAEEARRQSKNGRRVLFCCFNRNLGAYLRETMKDDDNVFVWHLHGFMEDAISRAEYKSSLPTDLDPIDLFEVIFPSRCCDAISKLHESGSFDVLIVDEGQDLLMPKYLDVFEMILNGGLAGGIWRIFLDPNQDIFENTSLLAIDRLMAVNPALAKLTVNCRNTAPIAVATSLLSGISNEATMIDRGPDVEYHWFSGEAEAVKVVSESVENLISEGLKAEQIVILSSRTLERSYM
ncbi:MAG: cbb3-type cytochrome c oxidase subunit I, partial [Proteobacteria bacterium]|nr:cbb3-type cytochrome c oxidase subunit I [Pseudomonadota bacterium]